MSEFPRTLYAFSLPNGKITTLPVPMEELLGYISERLECTEPPTIVEGISASSRWNFCSPPTRRDLLDCYRSLENLLEMGVDLKSSLWKTYDVTTNLRLQHALACVLCEHQFSGVKASEAFGHHPEIFDRAAIGQIAAGESTGSLASTFRRMAEYIEVLEKVRSQVTVAMWYPAGVVVVLYCIMSGIFWFVVPKLAETFRSMRIPLNPLSKAVMLIGTFISLHPWVLLAGPVAVILMIVFREDLLPVLLAVLRNTPVIRVHYRRAVLAQNVATIATLLHSRIQINEVIGMVADTTSDRALSGAYRAAQESMESGYPPPKALVPVFEIFGRQAKDFQAAVEIGHEGTNFAETLGRAGRIYQADFLRASESIGKIIEPLLMSVVGGAVGLIVIAIWYPLATASSAVH